MNELINEALANNPDIRAYREVYRSLKTRIKSEGMLDDPSLKMQIMELPQDNPVDVGRSKATDLSVNQLFPYPGVLSLKEDIATKESLVAKARLIEKELDIIKRVKDAYYDYYYIVNSIKITTELKVIISRMLKVAEVKYSAALVSQHDVIKAQVELSILQERLLDLRAKKEVIRARINTLLNRGPEETIPAPGEIRTGKVTINIESLKEEVLRNNPMLKSIEFELKSKEKEIELAKKDYYPNFTVGVGYRQRDLSEDAWETMVGINIPIWRSKYDARVMERYAKADAVKARLNSERNNWLFRLEDAYERFNSTVDIVALYKTGLLPQTELAFNSAIINYETGKVDFLTLLDNERVLLKTKLGYIKSIADYYKELAVIEQVVGRRIEVMYVGKGASSSNDKTKGGGI